MKKDERIENLFDGYFGGAQAEEKLIFPAKRALAEKQAAKKKKRPLYLRLGAAVSFALVFAVCVWAAWPALKAGSPPSDNTGESVPSVTYAADSLNKERTAYKNLLAYSEEAFEPFFVLETSSHASAEYFAYYDKESGTLMYAEIRGKLLTSAGMDEFVCRIEFSEGTFEGFLSYYELPESGSYGNADVFSETEYVDAEWVSAGYIATEIARYFVDVTSPSEDAFSRLLALFLG